MKYTVTTFCAVSFCAPFKRFLAFVVLGCSLSTSHADTTRTIHDLAPGITLSQEITSGDHPLIVNCLRVDLKTKTVHVRSGQALNAITLTGPSKGREPLHLLANRDGAIGGINADYFPFTGDPLGLEVRDGELMSEPMEYRACLGLTDRGVQMGVLMHYASLDLADNYSVSLAGINRVPQPGETVALCPTYGATPRMAVSSRVVMLRDVNLPVAASKTMQGIIASVTSLAAGAALPACPPGCTLMVGAGKAADALSGHCKEGDTVRFRFDLVSNSATALRGSYTSRSSLVRGAFQPAWTDVTEAVGGGPWLVRNGQIDVDWESERLSRVTFVDRRHPRTAAGVTADDVLLMVAVDGRSGISQGATLDELASIMKGLGAINAINLDGGGSTTMVARGAVVNAPTDGRERPIADSLLVYSDVEPGAGGDLTDSPVVLHAGESIPLKVSPTLAPEVDSTGILWGTMDGLGFVNQRGIFTSTHAGTGTVVAHFSAATVAIPVSVLPADPAILHATMTPIADYPPYYTQLTVSVTDRFGNPIPGVKLIAELSGGQLDNPLTTSANGQAVGQIVWDVAPEKRIVKVSALSLKPIVVRTSSSSAKPAISQDPDDR